MKAKAAQITTYLFTVQVYSCNFIKKKKVYESKSIYQIKYLGNKVKKNLYEAMAKNNGN